ncbi:MAG: response regulator [Thermoflexales bacterium]|nr:response regulator [Thermoflexales bacterium]
MTYTSSILIIDDEPSARDSLEVLLAPQGYHLAFAADGAEGLQKAAEIKPDLILLDVMMPGMDGFEVCRRLRADPNVAEIPIVMVTALDDDNSRLRGIETGADDFVSKPFNRTELRARVRTITRLNRYRRLLAERNRFEWVVKQSNDGHLVINERDEVLYANPQARIFLGLPQDEQQPVPAGFLELARRQYHCEPQEAWTSWPPATQQAHLYLVQPESPTAKAFWLQVELLSLPPGAGTGWLVHLRDVTAQMAMQRNVWKFHSLIDHKLSTPLNIMLNSLDLLVHCADLSSDDRGELSQMALNGVHRLRIDIGSVLRYLNVQTMAGGGGCFSLSRLPALAAEISARIGLEQVTVSVHPDLAGAQIVLSERAVELALGEILENALKFHPRRSPRVDILVSPVDDPASHTCYEASIQICDDGLTLSQEQLTRAWTPYYQGEKFFTGRVEGMGLGLPMVASLIWEVGGTCRMYNRQDGPGVVVEIVVLLARDCRNE